MIDDSTNATFLEKCRPKLQQLEEIRLQKLKVFKHRKSIAVPVGFVMTPILGFVDYWLLLIQRGSEDGAAGVTAVGLAMLWGWVTAPKRQYTKAYKKDILPEIARLFGNFEYDAKGKIPMEMMKPSKIVPHHTTYKAEDYFSGEYKGVGINFSEMELKRKSGKSTVTVFNGLAILLTHGTKKFHGHTMLTMNKGRIGEWFQQVTANLKRAKLVDIEFEELFDLYTNDQVEARYLIDPVIMENLKSLYEEYHGEKMMAAFYDDHFLILIESKVNHFEPADIETPATDEDMLLAIQSEIASILSIIDKLSLYDRRKTRNAA